MKTQRIDVFRNYLLCIIRSICIADIQSRSVNATSRDFYGITSSTSFAGLLLALAVAKPIPQSNISFPPRPQTSTLIQYYLDNVYVLLPFLVETNIWSSVEAVYQDAGRFATSSDHWIVHMILAIAAASHSQVRNDLSSQMAIKHVSSALKYAEDVLHPGSVGGIQAVLFLTQYSLLDPQHFRSWYLIGIAARVAADLGLHQEQHMSYPDKLTLDLRRRVFYCIYSLDR